MLGRRRTRRGRDPFKDVQGVIHVVPRPVAFRIMVGMILGTQKGIKAQERTIHLLRTAQAPLETEVVNHLRMYITLDQQVWFVDARPQGLPVALAEMIREHFADPALGARSYILPWPGDEARLTELPSDLPPQIRRRYLGRT